MRFKIDFDYGKEGLVKKGDNVTLSLESDINGEYIIAVYKESEFIGKIPDEVFKWKFLHDTIAASNNLLEVKVEEDGAFNVDIKTDVKSSKYNISGVISAFPKKSDLIKAFTSQEQIPAAINVDGDEIQVIWEGSPVGVISNDFDKREILENLDKERCFEVTLEKVSKSKVVANVVFKNEIKDDHFEGIEDVLESDNGENFRPKDYNKLIDAMNSFYSFPVALQKKIMAKWQKYEDAFALKIPPMPKNLYKDWADNMPAMLLSVLNGQNIYLEGPASAGKNVAITTIAWLLQIPLFDIGMTEDHSKTDLSGSNTMVPTEVNGTVIPTIKFQAEELIVAIENGCMVNLDELNLARSEVVMLMNGLLDFRCQTTISGYGTVKRHPNCIFTATGNEGAAYSGTKDLNLALKSRFNKFLLDPMDDIYPILMENSTNKPACATLSTIYRTFKAAVEANDASADEALLLIRCYLNALTLIDNGVSLVKAMKVSVLNHVKNEDDRDIALRIVQENDRGVI